MAKKRRYSTTRRTTNPRRAAVTKADSTGVPKDRKVSHGGHGHRTVNAPKPLY